LSYKDTECTEGEAKVRLASQAGAEFSNPSASGLARDSENASLIRSANTQHSSEAKSDPKALDSPKSPPSDWVYALKDVSFEVKRWEVLGIIGRNGAGKTTLLKMLNGLIKPDRGTITMRGRVGALIALGAGFNPILTGRSPRWSLARRLRLPINGSVLRLTKSRSSAKIEFMAGCGCQNKCPLAIR
jgi:ABC-type polysaccharide/polyol phosphate transport system ATPase subunit